ncbi:hypothetical protein [Mycobacterium sp. DL592]|uniref:hypothetical protein n=1 Tax=Mycobacterium sp. DL592 TaxID=2675524 RepID=UPI0014219809|nr:hypothetical protein [Mycobacterium sp. DL592]
MLRSSLDLVQLAGELLIPAAAVWIMAVVVRRHPTDVPRYTSPRITKALDKRAIRISAAVTLSAGLLIFGASIVTATDSAPGCTQWPAVLAALGMLVTLLGSMILGLAWAIHTQAGWVLLATFFALDLWIVFGMAMMHLKGVPDAPDAMLMLAFVMHAICMYLTTVWAFHARNLSTLAQIRAGEAGRSIGAVWLFLAAYIVVSFFHNETGPFDSSAGGAVLSALTLSALALTMGSGYTKYREVMAEQASDADSGERRGH